MTDTTARRSYLETARKAAAAGAAVLDDAFRSDEFEVERKTPTDLVTEIDRRAERAIADRIAAEYPDHALYAEESGLRGSSSYR
jgi:myo-inositol-1(or 4)-monophosphatase